MSEAQDDIKGVLLRLRKQIAQRMEMNKQPLDFGDSFTNLVMYKMSRQVSYGDLNAVLGILIRMQERIERLENDAGRGD